MPTMSRVFQGFLGFERAHVHLIEAEGVGAVVADDLVGIDDVAAALAHFETAGVDADFGVGFQDDIRRRIFQLRSSSMRRPMSFWPVSFRVPIIFTPSAPASSSMSRSSETLTGFPDSSSKDVEFGFAEDQALIDQSLNGSGGGDVAEIEQHLVPEARIEQMQDGMLDAADVEVDGHPVFFLFRIDELFGVVRIDIAQVIPADFRPIGAWCWFRVRRVGRRDLRGSSPSPCSAAARACRWV